MPLPIVTPELAATVASAYQRGQSALAIARTQRLGINTVRKCLKLAGVVTRSKERSPAQRMQSNEIFHRVIAMYQSGESCLEISLAFDVCSDTVRRWLRMARQHGLLSPDCPRPQPKPLPPREPRILRPIVIVGGRAPWGGWWCPSCPTRCNSRAELAAHTCTFGDDEV